MKNARILYVEDDLNLSFVTRDNLERAGYTIDFCDDGISAFEKITHGKYDLFILDIMLPKIDGYTLARKIREKDESVPILFLSAKSTKDDKIYGLQLGADDYITKPFSIEELVLKIEVFLKRRNIISENIISKSPLKLGCLTFDPINQQLSAGKKTHQLTQKENELLNLLVSQQDKIIKREEILRTVWGSDHFFASRSLDVFISRLRKLLKTEPGIRIENIHNMGYRFKIDNPA